MIGLAIDLAEIGKAVKAAFLGYFADRHLGAAKQAAGVLHFDGVDELLDRHVFGRFHHKADMIRGKVETVRDVLTRDRLGHVVENIAADLPDILQIAVLPDDSAEDVILPEGTEHRL